MHYLDIGLGDDSTSSEKMHVTCTSTIIQGGYRIHVHALTNAGDLATGESAAIRAHALEGTFSVNAVITYSSITLIYVCEK